MNTTTGEILDTQSKAPLFAKMARVMGKMDRLKKTGYNQQQKYQFATDADVADLVRQAMVEEGLAFFASMTSYEQSEHITSNNAKMTRTVASFLFTFCCTETGATESRTWSSESLDSGDKGMNKAATAAEKFFLLKTFIISTGDKADEPDYHSPEFSQDKSATPKKQQNGTRPAPPPPNVPRDPQPSQNSASENPPADEADDEPFVLRANWIVPHETKDGKVYYETEGGATTYSRELFHQKAGYTEQDTALWPTQLDRRIDLFAPLDVFYKIVTSKGRDYKRIVDMKKIEPEAF